MFRRFGHFRYIDVVSRIYKTGTTPSDFVTIRFFSYYAVVTKKNHTVAGDLTVVRCLDVWCNIPALYGGLLGIEGDHGSAQPFHANFHETLLFTKLGASKSGGTTDTGQMPADGALGNRLVLDCADLGTEVTQGVVLNGPYGFRRGGSQYLLMELGNIDLVMRLGGWTSKSDSFLRYICNLTIRGSWLTTLETCPLDEVVQIASATVRSHKDWVSRLSRATAERLWESADIAAAKAASEEDGLTLLLSIVSSVFRTLRYGPAT